MNIRLLVCVVLGTMITAGCAGKSAPDPVVYVVIKEFIDGDTLELLIDRRREQVRLLGIDTPETKHPTKPVQCFGPEATRFLTSLVAPGTRVHVVRDVEARDRFGRLLLHLFLTSPDTANPPRHVNAELVRGGYARILTIAPNFAFATALANAQVEARSARRGLWGACTQ